MFNFADSVSYLLVPVTLVGESFRPGLNTGTIAKVAIPIE